MDEDIQRLVDEGIFSPTGDGAYKVDWELFRSLHPAEAESWWNDHLAEVDDALNSLLEAGFIEASLGEDEDGNAAWVYSVTESGSAALREAGTEQ